MKNKINNGYGIPPELPEYVIGGKGFGHGRGSGYCFVSGRSISTCEMDYREGFGAGAGSGAGKCTSLGFGANSTFDCTSGGKSFEH